MKSLPLRADGTGSLGWPWRFIPALICIGVSLSATGALAAPAVATETRVDASTAATMPTPPRPEAVPVGDGTFLLTIFLRHDQSKPLPKINQQLSEQGFFKTFPPAGVEVVSWYVMMGIGQVVTLKVPAEKLREVNRAIENTAWGGYRTDFYPTYDYKAVAEQMHAKALEH